MTETVLNDTSFNNTWMWFAATPMTLDIDRAAQLFGAATTTRTGNDVYGYNISLSGGYRAAFDFAVNARPLVTVFDNGGTDTLDASGFRDGGLNPRAVQVDLRPGAHSWMLDGGGQTFAVIYRTTWIENAVGGAADDILIGNSLNNTLKGGAGRDHLTGREGNDLLDGGSGRDVANLLANRSSYALSIATGGRIEAVGPGAETDILSDVEEIQFADGRFDLVQLGLDDWTGSFGAPGTAVIGSSVGGALETIGDRDWFGILLEEGRTYRFDIRALGEGLGTVADTFLTLLGVDGGQIGTDDDGGPERDSSLIHTATGDGPYGIEVRGFTSDLLGSYLVRVLRREDLTHESDSFTGTDGDDWVRGLGGSDVLDGGAGEDLLEGGEGDDWIYGGTGWNTLVGGLGNDLYVVASDDDVVREDGSDNGIDSVEAGVDYALGSLLERLELWGWAVTGTGNGANNDLIGNDRDNTLVGAAGSDNLDGGAGIDEAVFSGRLADHDVVQSPDGTVEVVDRTPNSPGGTDRLVSIERLRFDDAVLNAPRVASPLAHQVMLEEGAWNFQVPPGAFIDVDAADVLTYSATLSDGTALPAWLSFDAVTRGFSGIAPKDLNDRIELTVRASDGRLSVSSRFELVIAAVNDAPRNLTLDRSTIREFAADGAVVGTLATQDVDSSSFSYTLLNSAGGRFALSGDRIVVADGLRLDFEQATTHLVQVRVSDGAGGSLTQAITIRVSDVSPEVITGDTRANTFVGGAGDDSLNGGAGNDRLVGRGGNDTFAVHTGDVVVELAGGGTADLVKSSSDWTLGAELEQLLLTGGAALDGTGNALGNRLTGNGAANALSGLGGNDTLLGGGGADTLDGGAGIDRLEGGGGNDTYLLAFAGDTVMELSGGGKDLVKAAVTHALANHVDDLLLTGAALNGTGNGLANRLTGNGSANALSGLGSVDALLGGGGADRLNGGAGVDSLFGGLGNDAFVVASRAEAGDRVLDFRNTTGDNDRFELTATAFGSGLAARAALTTAQFQTVQTGFVTGTTAASGQVRFIWEADDERLWSDTNGSVAGGLALLADLQNGASLTRGDLILV